MATFTIHFANGAIIPNQDVEAVNLHLLNGTKILRLDLELGTTPLEVF